MSTRHTPGPWKAVYVGCIDWDLDGPTTREDWMLAAAAPDLLEALQFVMTAHGEQLDTAFAQAHAAIAKATGEQP